MFSSLEFSVNPVVSATSFCLDLSGRILELLVILLYQMWYRYLLESIYHIRYHLLQSLILPLHE